MPDRRSGLHVQHQLALAAGAPADPNVETEVGSRPQVQAGKSSGAAQIFDVSSEPEKQDQLAGAHPHLQANMPAPTVCQSDSMHARLLQQQLANTPARRRPLQARISGTPLQPRMRPVTNRQQQLAEVPPDLPLHLQARHSGLTQQPDTRPEAHLHQQLAGAPNDWQPVACLSPHARSMHDQAGAYSSPGSPAVTNSPAQPQWTGGQVPGHAAPELQPPMYIGSPRLLQPPMYIGSPRLLQPPVQPQPLLHLPASRPGPAQQQQQQQEIQYQGFPHGAAELQLPMPVTTPGQQGKMSESYLQEASELQQSLQQDIDLSYLLAEWAEDVARAASIPDQPLQLQGQLPQAGEVSELQAEPLQQQRAADQLLPGRFDGEPGTSTWEEIASNQAVREAEEAMKRGQRADLSATGRPECLIPGFKVAVPVESLLVSTNDTV